MSTPAESRILLDQLLPKALAAGKVAGTTRTLEWLDGLLPAGVTVAPAEGDQPACMVGSLIAKSGTVSVSFGTSVAANLVGDVNDKPITAKSIDHFQSANGLPIYMVWLRNGTTWLNRLVETHGGDWEKLMKQLLDAPDDCGGLLSLPFLDDEPGLDVKVGGTAMVIGYKGERGPNDVGCTLKAALLSTIFNLRLGIQVLIDEGNVSVTEVVLTGGLTKTPETGQILADVFNLPVRLLGSEGAVAQEGCSWGAALLAKYSFENRHRARAISPDDFADFLTTVESMAPQGQVFHPRQDSVDTFDKMIERYQKLLEHNSILEAALR